MYITNRLLWISHWLSFMIMPSLLCFPLQATLSISLTNSLLSSSFPCLVFLCYKSHSSSPWTPLPTFSNGSWRPKIISSNQLVKGTDERGLMTDFRPWKMVVYVMYTTVYTGIHNEKLTYKFGKCQNTRPKFGIQVARVICRWKKLIYTDIRKYV